MRICRGSRWATRVILPIQCVVQSAFDSITDALNVAEFKWVCRVGTLNPDGYNPVMPSYRASRDQDSTTRSAPHCWEWDMAQEEPTLDKCDAVIQDSPLRPPPRLEGDPTAAPDAASPPLLPVTL